MRAALAVFFSVLLSIPGLTQAPLSRDIGMLTDLPAGPIRVVVIGDFGEEAGKPQEGARAVFNAIKARHEQPGQAYAFGITVGDNFYPSGVGSRAELDERWKATGYPSLKIPFYATLGNHDYRKLADAQIVTAASTWLMPFNYYTFGTPHARFVALDTDEGTTGHWNPLFLFGLIPRSWSDTQRDWVTSALTTHASATWKIVYGHHPIYSDGHHGDTSRLNKSDGLRQVLRDKRVDLYVAGHDHDLQYFAPANDDQGINFLVAGGGGRETRDVKATRAVFAKGAFGFAELVIDEKTLMFRIVGSDGAVLWELPKPLTK